MAKFTVTNTNILHNQKTYGAGDTIELTDKNQIAKLDAYITPVSEDTADSGSTEQSTDSTITAEASSTTTTTVAKTSKSGKKSDKTNSSADTTTTPAPDTAASTDAVASDATKQEGTNGTTSI